MSLELGRVAGKQLLARTRAAHAYGPIKFWKSKRLQMIAFWCILDLKREEGATKV